MPLLSHKRSVFVLFIIFASFIVLGSDLSYAQKKIYFINSLFGKIQRANPDGTELEDLVSARLNEPTDIKVDPEANSIYWSERGKIVRMDQASGNIEAIIELQEGFSSTFIPGFALDLMNDKLYWCNGSDDKIQRSNLDGSNIEDVVGNLNDPMSIALDVEEQKVYWTGSTFSGGNINRANFDGTEIEELVTEGIFSPSGLTLDLTNDKIYWADLVANEINRSNLEGTALEEVISSDLENPVGIVLNEEKTKMYWLDLGRTGASGKLQQANIDGSEVVDLVAELDNPVNLAIDPANDILFWLDDQFAGLAFIGRVNTDGINQEVYLQQLSGFEKLDLNEEEQKLYWMDQSSNDIFKANLDGAQAERIVETVTGNEFVFDSENQIYWTEKDAIRRANLDGSDVQDLITSDVDEPMSLELDVSANKMYWADGGFNADRIKWANLDGSENTDFITNLDAPVDLSLDTDIDKIYWLSGGLSSTQIQRANKNGTDVETVVSEGSGINSYQLLSENNRLFWSSRDIFAANLDGSDGTTIVDQSNTDLSGFSLSGLAIDIDNGKLYWNESDNDNDAIWRSNFDGSGLEEIISGLPTENERKIIVFGESPSAVKNNSELEIEKYSLTNGYPNPFNASTKIRFSLPAKSHVNLTVYNVSGQRIETLIDEVREAGDYAANFVADNLPSGIYFVRMKAKGFINTRKLTLLK